MLRPDVRAVWIIAMSYDLRRFVQQIGKQMMNRLERVPAFVRIQSFDVERLILPCQFKNEFVSVEDGFHLGNDGRVLLLEGRKIVSHEYLQK